MTRLRIVLLTLSASVAIVALLTFDRPAAPKFGPVLAIAATATPSFATACHGTIKIGTVTKDISKVATLYLTTALGTFSGNETVVEGGTPIGPCSFTGSFGLGAGPGSTFTTSQTYCTTCAAAPCKSIPGCKVCTGHPELASQNFTGNTVEKATEANFQSNETVKKDRTILCTSSQQ